MKTFRLGRSAPLFALSLALCTVTVPSKALADGSHQLYNVKNFGAQGNGTTDDTTAIRAAITAAGSNNGATVFFPPGTYLYSSFLSINGITLQGQGATLLSATNTAYVFMTGTSPAIQTLNFQGKTANLIQAVNVQTAQNPLITGNSFSSDFHFQVSMASSNNGTVSNNTFFMGNSARAVFIQVGSGNQVISNTFNLNSSAKDSVGVIGQSNGYFAVSSNTFNGNSINNNNSLAVATNSSTNAQIFLNTINGWYGGISSQSDNGTIVNSNNISNCNDYGILFAGDNGASAKANIINTVVKGDGIINGGNTGLVSLLSNTIASTGRSGIFSGTYGSFTGGSNLSVDGNSISNAGLAAATNAVIFTNQTSASSVSITNNQYKGNATNLTYFIHAKQSPSVTTVAGNKTNTLLPTKVGP